MDTQAQPLVSIVTPVYNGEKYLVECIESILAQTYQNWDYTIVNNCSTDRTLEIAKNYANKDNRIKVASNRHFVEVIENHNIAFRFISPNSKYCKVVSADDWIYPECITKLVELAERNPKIGIVGSYAINIKGIRPVKLPRDKTVFNGREICRLFLLGAVDFFGMPSGVLYRADLVRSRKPFFPGSAPTADADACFECLQESDFGFVHQILYSERIHDETVSAKQNWLNSLYVDRVKFLLEYGPLLLTHDAFQNRLNELLKDYYRVLALSVFNFRNKEFWSYHKRILKEIGYPFYSTRLANAVFMKLLDLLLNPKQTAEKMARRLDAK